MLLLRVFQKIKRRVSNFAYRFCVPQKSFSVSAENDDPQALTNVFRLLLEKAIFLAPKDEYVPGRILLVNAGLAAGGAERQIVNTLIGLKKAKFENQNEKIESVSLLCEYLLNNSKGIDFYLHFLKEQIIPVYYVQKHIKDLHEGLNDCHKDLADLLMKIPSHLAYEILNIVKELELLKPEIVHAWQDSTSIKCGIAAVIAGVPKIILSSRNVPPFNFVFYQPYMQPAYKALSALDNIQFINNSEKAAQEYCDWLQLPNSFFKIIRNGVNLDYLKKASNEEIFTWRNHLGIPENNYIIGSVFRFYSEKRSILWVRTAIAIAKKISNCNFLLVGDGPEREDMLNLIKQHDLMNRFHFVGVATDISLSVSCMDIFLLTSKFEGTPNVLIEAQWLGIPVVTANAGGAAETVNQEMSGKVLQEDDPDKISEIVIQSLEDIHWREKAKKAGPQFIKQRFGLDRMIQETLRLYSKD